jgi:hypothetical protein
MVVARRVQRNVTPRPAAQVALKDARDQAGRAEVPLELSWFLAAAVMPLLLVPWLLMASTLERQRFTRKARTLRRVVFGWLAFIASLVGLAVFNATHGHP